MEGLAGERIRSVLLFETYSASLETNLGFLGMVSIVEANTVYGSCGIWCWSKQLKYVEVG